MVVFVFALNEIVLVLSLSLYTIHISKLEKLWTCEMGSKNIFILLRIIYVYILRRIFERSAKENILKHIRPFIGILRMD